MSLVIAFERVLGEPDRDDGGRALIQQFDDAADDGLFVRLQSWSEKKEHPAMEALIGKRVRITVEVVDP